MKAQRSRSQLASVLACASLTGAFAATTYTLTDLGTGFANDINNSGKVVGSDFTGPWYFDGTNRITLQFKAVSLNAPPGSQPYDFTPAAVTAISDNGRIIGDGLLILGQPPYQPDGFYYDGGATGTLLGRVDTGSPRGVNASGEIVGLTFHYDGTNVVTLPGSRPLGRAINAAGLIVGNDENAAAIFSGGTNSLLDLTPVVASVKSPRASDVLSVNNAGQMVGYVRYDGASTDPSFQVSVAFLYTGGTATDLGGLGGLVSSANDINNAGLIVGGATLADNTYHAFVYADGAMADLNSQISSGGAGWVLNGANAVNDSGVIVGAGMKDGAVHAFMLTPVTGNLPPVISVQPFGTNLFVSESFTLGVVAVGSGPLTYQWQHAGTNVPGATNATYAMAHATADDGGGYLVKVSNAFGTTPSDSVTVQVEVVPEVELAFYAGIKITGPVGRTFRIESVEHVGDTNWQALGNVTLSSRTFLWVDPDSLQHPDRFYRAVPLP